MARNEAFQLLKMILIIHESGQDLMRVPNGLLAFLLPSYISCQTIPLIIYP